MRRGVIMVKEIIITVLAHIMVWVLWCIPGRAHRHARRLMAERKAARCDPPGVCFTHGLCRKHSGWGNLNG